MGVSQEKTPVVQPTITSEDGTREFVCSPIALVVLVINEHDEVLTGFHGRRQRWEAVSGALERQETLLEAAHRELREEMGDALRATPIGVVHARTFRYDASADFMVTVTFVMAYDDGEPCPGDDMSTAPPRWIPVADIVAGRELVPIPSEPWVFERACALIRQWRSDPVTLQPPL